MTQRKYVQSFVLLLAAALAGCRGTGRLTDAGITIPATSLVAAADLWWKGMTFGDTAYLREHTSNDLDLTLSNGQHFDKASLLAKAATHHPKPSTFVAPGEGQVVYRSPTTVIVRSSVREGSQGGSNEYRYLTVFSLDGSKWVVAAAQSTRVITVTPRVPAQVAGDLSTFEGEYRGGKGGLLRVARRGEALILTDPEGAESVLEPIGPGMFEMPRLFDGIAVVRFVFSRDEKGNVLGLSRMIYSSVTTWPRVR